MVLDVKKEANKSFTFIPEREKGGRGVQMAPT
jgi:hypothetical protein